MKKMKGMSGMLLRKLLLGASIVAFAVAPVGGQVALAGKARAKYAKTEVEKATGKCIAAVLGGALLGGIIGGKKGALIGAGAGSVICVILQVNAHNKDKIIAGQISAAANSENGYYSEIMVDNQNRPVAFAAQSGQIEMVEGSNLIPVRYNNASLGTVTSDVLDTGGQECRQVNSGMSYGENQTTLLPSQVVCRNSEGDWQPYALAGS